MKPQPKNIDPDRIYQSRQDQLKKWDDECKWKGLFVLAVIISACLFLL